MPPIRPDARLIGLAAALLLSASACAATPASIDAKTFGAKCDGHTNDTAALRAAAAAVPATGAQLILPKGTCVIGKTIFIKSHTHVVGNGTTLLVQEPWTKEQQHGYAMIENEHHAATTVTDSDMSVDGVTFDYGSFGAVPVVGGGKHAVRFREARDIIVANNIFQIRGAEDAVAGLGVVNMTVHNNKAYGFRNAAYDFWLAPVNVQVTDNYAETEKSVQVVNFNPEGIPNGNDGFVAKGLTLKNNTLVVTGPKAAAMILSPLSAATTSVREMRIIGNILRNVYMVVRGDVQDVFVSGNTFEDIRGGAPAFTVYPFHNKTPKKITFSNNKVSNTETQRGEVAVVRLEADEFVAVGNTIKTTPASQAQPFEHNGHTGTDQDNVVAK